MECLSRTSFFLKKKKKISHVILVADKAVTLRPSCEFLSCRVCVALPMFMEDTCLPLLEGKIAAEAFKGLTLTPETFTLGR